MAPSSDAARQYSRAHGDRFLQELDANSSAFPASAATRPMPRTSGVRRSGLRTICAASAPKTSRSCRQPGYPVVYGDWLGAGADKPTVLVYGHYDVVPAAIEDGWDTPPFEPVVKDGKMYARGATDDKGQLFIHVKALESYLKAGDGTAGQSEVPARGRGRGLLAQPAPVHRNAPRFARGRRLRDQRFVDADDRAAAPSPTACAA